MKQDDCYRMTRQRMVILDTLRGMTSHPTADEVYDIVRGILPHISLGTVYRNLEVLTEMGLIMTLDIGCGQRRYDGRAERHYHLRCTVCERVVDIPGECVPDFDCPSVDRESNRIDDYSLHFIGLCADCAELQAMKEASVND